MELFGDREALYAMPEVFPAALFDYPGVKQLFYSGPAWRGRPTRVFACCGVPEGASPENPVPGVVLIHGGGATALADWVALWNRRGYAAISMDTCGCVPGWSVNPYCNRSWPRHEFSGPSGWSESMHEADLPPEEQQANEPCSKQRQNGQHLGGGDIAEGAHFPVLHGCQLIVGVGKVFEHHDKRLGYGVDNDACQHIGGGGTGAGGPGQQHHTHNRRQAAPKGADGRWQNAGGADKHNGRGSTQIGAAGYPNDIRGGQWVFKDQLIHTAG